MAGISDQAAMMPENKQLFNDGSELQHEEFSKGILSDSDRTGLNWYNMPYRNYDPQTGRFNEPDPLGEKYPGINPYQFAYNMPDMFIDPRGLDDTTITNPDGNLISASNGATSSDNGQTVQNSNGQTIYTWDSNCGCYDQVNLPELDVVGNRNGMPDNDYDWMMLNMGLFQFHSRGTDLAGQIIHPRQFNWNDLPNPRTNEADNSHARNTNKNVEVVLTGTGLAADVNSTTWTAMSKISGAGATLGEIAEKGTVVGIGISLVKVGNDFANGNLTWKDGVTLGIAAATAISMFTGVGEVAVGVASISWEVYDAATQ